MSHTASASLHRTSIGIEPPVLEVLTYEARARGLLVPEMIRKIVGGWAEAHPMWRTDLGKKVVASVVPLK